MYTGPDCGERVCPYGQSHDTVRTRRHVLPVDVAQTVWRPQVRVSACLLQSHVTAVAVGHSNAPQRRSAAAPKHPLACVPRNDTGKSRRTAATTCPHFAAATHHAAPTQRNTLRVQISDAQQGLVATQLDADNRFVGLLGANAASANRLKAFVNNGVLNIQRDLGVDVRVVSVSSSPSDGGKFQWKLSTAKDYSAEVPFGGQAAAANKKTATSRATAVQLQLSKDTATLDTGVYVHFDYAVGEGSSSDAAKQRIFPGDVYFFNITYNRNDRYYASEGNSAHQNLECSGKGVCNRATGQCRCPAGYTGDACQRRRCVNDCSGHGICQSQQLFYQDGTDGAAGYATKAYDLAYDADSEFGCRCDAGFRGADCSNREYEEQQGRHLAASGPPCVLATGETRGRPVTLVPPHASYPPRTAHCRRQPCMNQGAQGNARAGRIPWAATAAQTARTAPAAARATTPLASASASRATTASVARSRRTWFKLMWSRGAPQPAEESSRRLGPPGARDLPEGRDLYPVRRHLRLSVVTAGACNGQRAWASGRCQWLKRQTKFMWRKLAGPRRRPGLMFSEAESGPTAWFSLVFKFAFPGPRCTLQRGAPRDTGSACVLRYGCI
jgi:hypothetical protein